MLKEVSKKDLDMKDFNKGVKILNFHATWCGACKMFGPILNEVGSEGYDVYKINIDEDKDFAIEHDVKSIPATFIYNNGKIVNSFVGFRAKEELIDILNDK